MAWGSTHKKLKKVEILFSWFACNTRVIVDMQVQIHRFPMSNCFNKNLESIHQVNKQTLHH